MKDEGEKQIACFMFHGVLFGFWENYQDVMISFLIVSKSKLVLGRSFLSKNSIELVAVNSILRCPLRCLLWLGFVISSVCSLDRSVEMHVLEAVSRIYKPRD